MLCVFLYSLTLPPAAGELPQGNASRSRFLSKWEGKKFPLCAKKVSGLTHLLSSGTGWKRWWKRWCFETGCLAKLIDREQTGIVSYQMCYSGNVKCIFFLCLTTLAILVTLLDMNEKPTRPPARKFKVQIAKPPMTSSQKTTATATDAPAPSIDITTANINVSSPTSAPSINITTTHSTAITTATSAPTINITTAPSIDVTTATGAPSIHITTTPSMNITTANIAPSVEITTATTAPTAPNVDTTTREKKRKSSRKKGMGKHKKKMGRRKGEQTDRRKKLKGKPGRSRVDQPINESVSLVYPTERNHGWDLIQTVLSRSGYLFYFIVIISFFFAQTLSQPHPPPLPLEFLEIGSLDSWSLSLLQTACVFWYV